MIFCKEAWKVLTAEQICCCGMLYSFRILVRRDREKEKERYRDRKLDETVRAKFLFGRQESSFFSGPKQRISSSLSYILQESRNFYTQKISIKLHRAQSRGKQKGGGGGWASGNKSKGEHWGGGEGHTLDHGLINFTGTKTKCRHLKILTCKGTLRQVFIRVYRLEIESVMLVFSTQLRELTSPSHLLSVSTFPPYPFPVWISILYTRIHSV